LKKAKHAVLPAQSWLRSDIYDAAIGIGGIGTVSDSKMYINISFFPLKDNKKMGPVPPSLFSYRVP